jgi:hypothetical protein
MKTEQRAVSKEIFSFEANNFLLYYRVHINPSLNYILSGMNLFHILGIYMFFFFSFLGWGEADYTWYVEH